MKQPVPSPHYAGLSGITRARLLIWHSRFAGLHSFSSASTLSTCAAVSSRYSMAAIARVIGTNSALRRSSLLSPSLLTFRRGIAYKLFVGGLSFFTTEKGLSEAFSEYGQVMEAKIVMNKVSDRSKGFGFVTFASEDEAENAITGMNGKALNGRVIFVDYAKPKSNIGDEMPIARGPPEPKADN